MATLTLNPLFPRVWGAVGNLTFKRAVGGGALACATPRPDTPGARLPAVESSWKRVKLGTRVFRDILEPIWRDIAAERRMSVENCVMSASLKTIPGSSHPTYTPPNESIAPFPLVGSVPGPASGQITFTWDGTVWNRELYLTAFCTPAFTFERFAVLTQGVIDCRAGTCILNYPPPRISWMTWFIGVSVDPVLYTFNRRRQEGPLI